MTLPYEEQEPIWDARPGLVRHGAVTHYECVRRLHRALPSLAHARRLVAAMLEQLGERGRLDPYTSGLKAMVLRADPEGWWLRRSPAALYEGATQNEADVHTEVPLFPTPADAPEGWRPGERFRPEDPPPDIGPEGLGEAVLDLWTGRALVEMRYDERGLARPDGALCRFGDRWAERRWGGLWPPCVDPAARPPQAAPPAWFVDLPESISPEALAARILAADTALDPVRVRMEVDAPGGVEGCWWRGRMHLQKLAWDEALPTGGGVYVVDAFDQEAGQCCLAVGATLAEAEAAWMEAEPGLRPRPAKREPRPPVEEVPSPPPEPTKTETVDEDGKKTLTFSTGPMTIVVRPVREIPWPIPGPRTTPLVAVRFPPLPAEVPAAWREAGFSRWRYVVGDSGAVGFVLIREDAEGFTIAGDGVLDLVDPATLDAALDAAIEADGPFPFPDPPWLRYPFEHRPFRVWSDLHQAPISPRTDGASWNAEWNWRDLDGDVARWRVYRLRHRG